MSSHSYSIREAAALTGVPASTLRYYESIGINPSVDRGETSGHRMYDENDLDELTWVACLAATGLSTADMKQYVANSKTGRGAASGQIDLLVAQRDRLVQEAERLALRRRYVDLKIEYWHAVEAGDEGAVRHLSEQSRALADELKRTRN